MHTDGPTIFEQIILILKASRPAGWCFGPILFGMGLIHSHVTYEALPLLVIIAIEAFSLSVPLCIILFGINDVYDYKSDIKNPRKSGLEGSILLPAHHSSVRRAAYLSTVFVVLSSLFAFRSQKLLATLFLLFLVWQYSAPPLRFKEIPILDSLSNGLIVFLAWFIGYSRGGGGFDNIPIKIYALAFCTIGVHALGAAVDEGSDRAAGQITIATFFGQRPAIIFSVTFYAIALFFENSRSVFGIYLWAGFAIMLIPCLDVRWAHRCFKAIVYWTVGMSMVWFGSKALSIRSSILKRS